jgi:IstB-like ATP binding protein
MSQDDFSDEELAARAAASQGRLDAPDGTPPATASTTLGDVLQAAERARAAAEAAGLPETTDAQERHLRLRHVLEQLPAGMHRATRQELESRIEERVLRAVLGWRWGSGNLVLTGATGCGKTSGAAHLVRRLCFEGAIRGGEAFELAGMIRWQSCRDLSEVGRETRLGTGTPEVVQRCQYARLLVLNDLGLTDDRATLERVMDARYERGWPTITTTGLGAEQLEQAFGDALSRRLLECGAHRGRFVAIKRVANG